MAEKTKYTNEEVLNQLRDFLKRNGNITVNSFKADKTVCAVNTVIRRFGSWNKALKKIGLTPKEKNTKMVPGKARSVNSRYVPGGLRKDHEPR